MTLPIIEADFPGANILVEAIEPDCVRLRQDRRTTTQWWFYWNFRIRNVAGRTFRFDFTDGNVFGAMGPCYSPDGNAWRWLGTECVDRYAFTHTFPADQDSACFAFCFPYVESHLRAFLAAHPRVRCSTLALSEQSRAIERLTLESAQGTYLVPILARAHACETMGSYALEGIMAFWLGASPESRFLQTHVDLQIVPFVDKDGVEAGDQGKLRAPHDHNRDYIASPLYATTRALMEQLPTWRGRMVFSLDLHCPWIRGGRNEEIFLCGMPQPWQAELDRFAATLEAVQQGELVYSRKNDIAYGEDWNTEMHGTSQTYIQENFPVAFGCALEIPYARAGGKAVTPDGARQFGQDIGRAIARTLSEL